MAQSKPACGAYLLAGVRLSENPARNHGKSVFSVRPPMSAPTASGIGRSPSTGPVNPASTLATTPSGSKRRLLRMPLSGQGRWPSCRASCRKIRLLNGSEYTTPSVRNIPQVSGKSTPRIFTGREFVVATGARRGGRRHQRRPVGAAGSAGREMGRAGGGIGCGTTGCGVSDDSAGAGWRVG